MRKFSVFLMGLAFGLGIALSLSACSLPTQQDSDTSQIPAPSLLTEASLPESEAPIPTKTKIPPLRFTIPTPGAEPISDWRPPLYPVPWAISPNDHFYFVRPIAADEINWALSSYLYGGVFFSDVVHTGIDITADEGVPIYAAGPGEVVWATWGFFSGNKENKEDAYGQSVSIEHDFGYKGESLYTLYAHMSRVDVVQGQWVNTGDQLGLVGKTGQTTGPHLHFEVRLGENDFYHTYNPDLWLAPPQGWGVLVGRIMNNKGDPLRHYQLRVISYKTGRQRTVRSYGPKVVNSDPYYDENLVMGDLAPGWYELQITYTEDERERELRHQIEIFPGQVSYFTFRGMEESFQTELPESPGMEALTPTPTKEWQ